MLPAQDPRYVVAIMLDAPQGGTSAAPLFHDIGSYLAQREKLPVSPDPQPVQTLVVATPRRDGSRTPGPGARPRGPAPGPPPLDRRPRRRPGRPAPRAPPSDPAEWPQYRRRVARDVSRTRRGRRRGPGLGGGRAWGGGRASIMVAGSLPACRTPVPPPSQRLPCRRRRRLRRRIPGRLPHDAAEVAAAHGPARPRPGHRRPGSSRPTPSAAVTGVTLRAAEVRPGDLFAALPGARAHGADFVGRGASRREPSPCSPTPPGSTARRATGLPVLVHPQPRDVLGAAAATVYGDPTRRLRVLGVTGTSGKTTVAHLLEAGLAAAGRTHRPDRHRRAPGSHGASAAQRVHHARRRPTCRRCSR